MSINSVLLSAQGEINVRLYSSAIGFRCHHEASRDPVMFTIGPNTAEARPTVATLPISFAMPEASLQKNLILSILWLRVSHRSFFNYNEPRIQSILFFLHTSLCLLTL